jgi:LacI family transcriptional regulator
MAAIDWRIVAQRFDAIYDGVASRQPFSARLIIGLSILRQLYKLSDEALCKGWLENPYYQYFCGQKFFQHSLSFDRTSVMRSLRRVSNGKLCDLVRAALSVAKVRDEAVASCLSRLGIDPPLLAEVPRLAVEGQSGEARKTVSIYDVAKASGVSIKTVSLVINRRPNVNKQTRSAVFAAIKALEYRPNVFARSLASNHSYLIGMLCDELPGSYVVDLQVGALARCHQEGFHLIVEVLDSQDTELPQRVHALITNSPLRGVILTPPFCDAPAVIDELTRARLPFVRISPGTRVPGSLTISINEHKAAYDMTFYLIGLGHRRIGFIKGKPRHLASLARLEGYRTALMEAGLPFVEELCAQGYFSYQSGMDAAVQLLSLPDPPTAIFAGNDDMAAGVLAASQRFNLRIPDQLSIAGFDDSLVAEVVWPRLTTCRQPVKEMAATAISILAQKRGDDAVQEYHLDHKLIVRESTASPCA